MFENISGRKIRRNFSFGSENRICGNTWVGKRNILSEKFEVALAVLRYRGCIRGRIDGGDLLFGDVSKHSNAQDCEYKTNAKYGKILNTKNKLNK